MLFFKLKLSPERIQSFFKKKKKKLSQFRVNTSIQGGSYNLEEFYNGRKRIRDIPLVLKPSQFEVNKSFKTND
jgi:S-DNA-T family DNA segregation ATPase FtsK/SpoIIIE